jgi:hypothetical protein
MTSSRTGDASEVRDAGAWVPPVHDYTSDTLAWVYYKMGRFPEA